MIHNVLIVDSASADFNGLQFDNSFT